VEVEVPGTIASIARIRPSNAQKGLQVRDAKSVLVIENLSMTYKGGTPPVIGPMSLELARGEFVSIVGPSGCGKTTLLNCIGGHLTPTTGSVSINGVVVDRPLPQIGTVFQRPNLFPWLDVLDNVAFGLQMRRVPVASRHSIARSMLQLVGLAASDHAKPYELSGGMQQRVALARALAIEPELLLMDEPLGALDAITRERMQQEILRIWQATQATILFITHSIDEAILVGQRVAIFGGKPGRIREIVDTSSIHTRDPDKDPVSASHFLRARAQIEKEIELVS
jgi:ABC-type nitrate/sulfonate/bicarbonate transport system ATPase subunit